MTEKSKWPTEKTEIFNSSNSQYLFFKNFKDWAWITYFMELIDAKYIDVSQPIFFIRHSKKVKTVFFVFLGHKLACLIETLE